MSYEEAPQTKMLATHCACCDRPLCDALSVEIGMGPVCREKHGYAVVAGFDEVTRKAANVLIWVIAVKRNEPGIVVDACKELFKLGAIQVVAAILRRVAKVQVALTEADHPHGAGRLAVHTPYYAEAVDAMRKVPGRLWDKAHKVNTFPVSSKLAVYEVFQKFWAGEVAVGPKGPFVIPAKAA